MGGQYWDAGSRRSCDEGAKPLDPGEGSKLRGK